jgi:hypothetical protein
MITQAMELKSDSKTYIRRWRLEPKILQLNRGELVEPRCSRLLYIDPATPEKLNIKQGT